MSISFLTILSTKRSDVICMEASTSYGVHQCSKCPGDTAYFCKTCSWDLCPQCKENHAKYLKTIYHNVSTYMYHRKINCTLKQEICLTHPSNVYSKFCEPCQIPMCHSWFGHKSHRISLFCFGQSQHKVLSIKEAYITKRQQHEGTMRIMRDEALFYLHVLLTGIKTDIKTCIKKIVPLSIKYGNKGQKHEGSP